MMLETMASEYNFFNGLITAILFRKSEKKRFNEISDLGSLNQRSELGSDSELNHRRLGVTSVIYNLHANGVLTICDASKGV